MPLRFLHSAAWQLGLGSRVLPAVGPRLREARFAAAQRLLTTAHETEADFILLAGDTFAHPTVGAATVERALALFAAAPCPVYVLPGLQDAPLAGSVWERPEWQDAANVTVLGVPPGTPPVRDPGTGAALYAFPPPAWAGDVPPPSGQPPQQQERIRIGVACSASHVPGTGAATLDYLALGCTDEADAQELPPQANVAPAAEAADFADPAGAALLVELDGPGSGTPRVESVPTGVVRWRTHTVEIHSRAELDNAAHELAASLEADEVLRLCLRGRLPLAEATALDAWLAHLESRGVAVVLEIRELAWVPPEERDAAQLPPGPVRDAFAQLTAQAPHDGTAQEALRELLTRLAALQPESEDERSA